MFRLRPLAKRCLDIAAAILLLVLSTPIVLACFLAVWIESGAPLVYRRRGVRRGGVTFDPFKIRTMMADAGRILSQDESLQRQFREASKIVRDPRGTRGGPW